MSTIDVFSTRTFTEEINTDFFFEKWLGGYEDAADTHTLNTPEKKLDLRLADTYVHCERSRKKKNSIGS